MTNYIFSTAQIALGETLQSGLFGAHFEGNLGNQHLSLNFQLGNPGHVRDRFGHPIS